MKVLIIHYHLQVGGVTSVIYSQIKALRNLYFDYNITLLAGSRIDTDMLPLSVTFIYHSELNYLNVKLNRLEFSKLVNRIIYIINQASDEETIIHVHNHSLGKNPALTLAIYKLAELGKKIFCLCHDFPDSNRPKNSKILKYYFKKVGIKSLDNTLYPNFKFFFLGVLNSKDFDSLVLKKIKPSRIDYLPNPLVTENIISPLTSKEIYKKKVSQILQIDIRLPFIIYPVRAITRKNIPEFVLIACLFKGKANFMITLPPLNLIEKRNYLKVVDFCAQKVKNVIFEAGLKVDFKLLMKSADLCLSTSYLEGFGMSFLEPWLWGIPVVGRNISFIINEHKKLKIKFPLLYDNIIINRKDFADYSFRKQLIILNRICCNEDYAKVICKKNPFLLDILKKIPPEYVKQNQSLIKKHFSLKNYGNRLHKIYTKIVKSPNILL